MIQMALGTAESHKPALKAKKLFIALSCIHDLLCFKQHCAKAACASLTALQLLIQFLTADFKSCYRAHMG